MIVPILLAVAVQTAPARDAKPAAQSGHATIRGRIVAGDTGRPIGRARITLSAPELKDGERTTSTNRDGRYELDNLPAGRYSLSVIRPGYLTLRYGQRRPLEQGKTLEIRDNQRVENVDLALPRSALITGRITDETGEPMADVRITALRPMYVDGLRQLVPDASSSDVTDSAGEYRINGLAPSAYAVLATFNDTWTVTQGNIDTQMGYAPTYFPGTSNITGARRIVLNVGQEARNTDFSLVTGRTATVSGTAYDSHGRPLQTAVVFQVSSLGSAGFRTFGGPGTVRVADDGAFSIRSVPPGDYQLVASSRDEMASIPITVDGADISGLALIGSRGWSISGRITTEDGNAPALQTRTITVSALRQIPLTSFRFPGPPEYNQRLNPDWTFSVSGVTGPARLRVGLPPGWVLKAALQDGRDIADTTLELDSGATLAPVQLVITNQLGSVSGQVTDDKSAPIADGTIVLFPADASKWHDDSRYVRATRPNQSGRFEMTGLLPGDYFALAVDYVEQGSWNDPDYLESLRGHTTAVTLIAGHTVEVALPLVTP